MNASAQLARPPAEHGGPDAMAGLATAILLGVIGPEVFIVQPGFVQGLVQHAGFDEAQAGYVASAEMFGIAATTVALTFCAHRLDWRVIIRTSLLVMFAANAACLFLRAFETFAVLRFLAGLGAGGLVSLSFTAIGLSSNPDRNFGLLIAWVLTYGALGLLLMPAALNMAGLSGVLAFFALFPLVALPFVHYMPRRSEAAPQKQREAVEIADVEIGTTQKASALLAMLIYFLAQGVVWAYLFVIGVNGGLGEQQVANGLMVSQFAGIAGALLAAALARRAPRMLALLLGIAGGALVLYPLVSSVGALQYAAIVTLYNFAWNFTHPFLLGTMASFDRRGRIVVLAVAAQMCGLALGPGLAASIVEAGAGLAAIVLTGMGLFLLSLALIVPPVLATAQARPAAAAG